MLELFPTELRFSFPDLEPWAILSVVLVRSARLPENGAARPLFPGNDRLSLLHVDDFADGLPPAWRERGGVLAPLYPGEGVWIGLSLGSGFGDPIPYPFAVKAGTGKVNMLTLDPWKEDLDLRTQDYAFCPPQRWIPGMAGQDRSLRQLVATPLHSGRTVEEALLGEARHGGIQLAVVPMRHDAYRAFCRKFSRKSHGRLAESLAAFEPDLGMGWGAPIREEILPDPHGVSAWDPSRMNRVFIHLADARSWKNITGEDPPPPLAGPGGQG